MKRVLALIAALVTFACEPPESSEDRIRRYFDIPSSTGVTDSLLADRAVRAIPLGSPGSDVIAALGTLEISRDSMNGIVALPNEIVVRFRDHSSVDGPVGKTFILRFVIDPSGNLSAVEATSGLVGP